MANYKAFVRDSIDTASGIYTTFLPVYLDEVNFKMRNQDYPLLVIPPFIHNRAVREQKANNVWSVTGYSIVTTTYGRANLDYTERVDSWNTAQDLADSFINAFNTDYFTATELNNVEFEPIDLGVLVDNVLGMRFTFNLISHCEI